MTKTNIFWPGGEVMYKIPGTNNPEQILYFCLNKNQTEIEKECDVKSFFDSSKFNPSILENNPDVCVLMPFNDKGLCKGIVKVEIHLFVNP